MISAEIRPEPAAKTNRPAVRHPAATAQFVAGRQAPLRALLNEAVADGSLPGLDVETALAQLLGPFVYRRLITSEPLDERLCANVVQSFLRGHAAG